MEEDARSSSEDGLPDPSTLVSSFNSPTGKGKERAIDRSQPNQKGILYIYSTSAMLISMFNARFVPCRVQYGNFFFKSKIFFSCYPQISEQSVPLPEFLWKAVTHVSEASQSHPSHGLNDTEPIIISSDSEAEPRIVAKSSKQRRPHHVVGGGQILTGTVKVQDRTTGAFLSDSDGAIRTSGVDTPGISNSQPGKVPGAKELEGGKTQFV